MSTVRAVTFVDAPPPPACAGRPAAPYIATLKATPGKWARISYQKAGTATKAARRLKDRTNEVWEAVTRGCDLYARFVSNGNSGKKSRAPRPRGGSNRDGGMNQETGSPPPARER